MDDQPGVTRDRKEAPGSLADLPLVLIDTAGYEDVNDDSLESRMRAQTEIAIEEAELALFLIDARAGVTPMDERFARCSGGRTCRSFLQRTKPKGKLEPTA